MNFEEELQMLLGESEALPTLFVGAGSSKRYLSTPSWAELLEHFANKTTRPYDFYRSAANSDLPATAQLIAHEFHPFWFTAPEYHDKCEALKSTCSSIETPLKIEVSDFIGQFKEIRDIQKEIETLASIPIQTIITTNYDDLLEKIFPDHAVYVGQDELILSESFGIGEIYKIHGSIEKPDSLVLTKTDYDRFNKRNVILIAKLLTMIIEHPIVFLGYGLNDINVRSILSSIVGCLESEAVKKLAGRIFIVHWNPRDAPKITQTSMRIDDLDLPVTNIETDDYLKIFNALSSHEQKIPTKVLRMFKKSIYNLVRTNDPTGRLSVVDLNSIDEFEAADYVVGIGIRDNPAKFGYRSIDRDHVINYLLKGGDYNPTELLQECIPYLLAGGQCPVFKFLKESGKFKNNVLIGEDLPKAIVDRAKMTSQLDYASKSYIGSREQVNHDYSNLKELLSKLDPSQAIYRIALLDREKITTPDLRDFLIRTETYFSQKNKTGHISNWRKVACLFDFLEYGPKL